FSGDAHLTLDLPPGEPIRTGGGGRGVVTGAPLLGGPTAGFLALYLRPTGGGVRVGAGPRAARASVLGAARESWLVFLAGEGGRPVAVAPRRGRRDGGTAESPVRAAGRGHREYGPAAPRRVTVLRRGPGVTPGRGVRADQHPERPGRLPGGWFDRRPQRGVAR